MAGREEALAAIRAAPDVSVLIVGGGINGIGTFRDLALNGVDVLLVEQGDFCSGASAASSHMIHGGLRYLENAEFRLVQEALLERNRLLVNAPHYVKPLPTTIPIFNWFSGLLNAPLKFLRLRSKPGSRGALVIKLGLTLYDLYARRQRVMPAHRFTSRQKSLQERPQINPAIVCTATYYDSWMPYPERICLELVLDGEASSPHAHALNYVSAESAANDTVALRDQITGEVIHIRPKVVINAAGPWIDRVNGGMQRQTQFIGGTKGSHLVVDHPELHAATRGHEMFFENVDGRICLFFPLEDRVLIGTTDIPIEDPDQARCTDEEVEYMLSMVRLVFPGIDVRRDQIVFRFSGVRPLPSSDAATPGQISRDHSLKITEPGKAVGFPILSLIGGKWTTFRAFAEQAADEAMNRLGMARRDSTADLPIGGGRDHPRGEEDTRRWLEAQQRKTGLPIDRLDPLLRRYGTRAAEVGAYIMQDHDAMLEHVPGYSRREVGFVAQHEKVQRLEDFVLRRSLLAMLGRIDLRALRELSAVIGQALGWTDEQINREVGRTADLLHDRHGAALENASAPAAQPVDGR
jgi:glycerol-3-phosphate dehydrogenase